jgi:hypothetical protein
MQTVPHRSRQRYSRAHGLEKGEVSEVVMPIDRKRVEYKLSCSPALICCSSSLEIASHSILVSRTPLQIAIETHLHLENLSDVAHRQGLRLIDRERLGSADRVLDLPAVEFVACQDVEILLGERHEVDLLEDADALDEDLEYGLLGLLVETVVAEGYVDTRLEGVVEGLVRAMSVISELSLRNFTWFAWYIPQHGLSSGRVCLGSIPAGGGRC